MLLKNQQVETFFNQLIPILSPELNRELEDLLDQDLAQLKGDEALSLVDKMYLEPQQKELLKFYINRRQANLATAISRTVSMHALSPEKPVAELQREVTEDAAILSKLKERIDWYRYSAITNGSCTPDWIRKEVPTQDYSIQEYARLVANAEDRFPLNSWVLDQAFFATLLSKPYEDTESFGDKILNAKGTLRIPFYSRDMLFDLVIDKRSRRIRTEIDSRVQSNESGSDRMEPLIAFDLRFDQVTSISQKGSSDTGTFALAKESYAVKLEPTGLAPYYAFMDAVQCLYGEAAQKTVTENLGRFLAHVMASPTIVQHLVDPEKKTIDWLRFTSETVALGTVAASEAANIGSDNGTASQSQQISAEAMKTLAADKEEAAQEKSITSAQEEERQTWHSQLIKTVFSEIEADRAHELETFESKLLSLTGEAEDGK